MRLSRAGVPGLMALECVAGDCARTRFDESRLPVPPEVSFTSVYSRRDGIVAPAAARGTAEESDKTVEFTCNHMAFGVSARTARAVVDEIRRFLAEHRA